jgi:hypothetical protein
MKKAYVTKSLVCRPDGTVTYWSALLQEWVRRATSIPEKDLAAMSPAERARALYHLTLACAHAVESFL